MRLTINNIQEYVNTLPKIDQRFTVESKEVFELLKDELIKQNKLYTIHKVM